MYVLPFDAAGTIHQERATQLPRISCDTRLSEPAAPGVRSTPEHARIECSEPGAPQAGGTVDVQARIDVQRQPKLEFVTERGGLLGPAVPDGDDLYTPGHGFLLDVAQLRELLATEDSPEVPDENEQGQMTA